jgi:hypothetical protein
MSEIEIGTANVRGREGEIGIEDRDERERYRLERTTAPVDLYLPLAVLPQREETKIGS